MNWEFGGGVAKTFFSGPKRPPRFGAAGKSGTYFLPASKFAGKTFPARIFGQPHPQDPFALKTLS